MKLKSDPLGIFEADDSPIALYARNRWMNGSGRVAALARDTVRRIEAAQSPDGSWEGAVAPTIQHLFSLWLLSGQAIPAAAKAVAWLCEAKHPPLELDCRDGATYSGMFFRTTRRDHEELRKLRTVPFTPGCSGFVKTGAALFFAAQFGRATSDRMKRAFVSVNRTAKVRRGKLCTGSCANNLHLALAGHPRQRQGPGMAHVLNYLARAQTPAGSWANGLPFFPTLWALSHLNSRAADALLLPAFRRLQRTQNRDGSWGRSQRQLFTFLALDALSRKGAYPDV